MNIYIVKTADGPVYFKGTRARYKAQARDLAAEMVVDHASESQDYEPDDRYRVSLTRANESWNALWKALIACGAITVVQTRD